MSKSLYDVIMGDDERVFTKNDWSLLGKGGEGLTEDEIERMLEDGYEAVAE